MHSTQCKLRTWQPFFTGSHPGKLDTKTREAYGTPPTISPTCPFPRGSVSAGGLGPPREPKTLLPDTCSLPVLPPTCQAPPTQLALWLGSCLTSSSYPLGKDRGECWAHTGQGPLDNTGSWEVTVPPASSCHTLDTARIEGDEGDKEGQPSTMVLSPGFLLHPPPLTHWTWG